MTVQLLAPRRYQDDCLHEILKAYDSGTKRAAVVLPTGSGKTVIFSHLTWEWQPRPGRILILVHREELITQAIDKLKMVAPNLKVGVIKAKQDVHEGMDVVIGSVQTLRKTIRLDQLKATGYVSLLIIDECHHATAASYVKIMTELGCFDQDADVYAVGFTATLARNDKTSLGDIWEKVVYQRDILDMIDDNYLVDVKGKLITVNGLSLADVAMSGGDYQVRSLSDALMSSDAPDFVAQAYAEHAVDLPGICFTPTVETAHAFADALSERGIVARPIWGNMKDEDRRNALASAHQGNTQVLVNCMVLTEGFDWPRAQCAVIARPTTFAGLYVQMTGRILRPYPGKTQSLVLDVVGASEAHRLACLADLTSRRIPDIQEGESLIEAVVRAKRESNPWLQNYVVHHREIDLFQRSTALWLQTYEGIWFVSTGDWIYFVWPTKDPDRFSVGRRAVRSKDGGWLHKGVSLDYARAWVETEVLAFDPMIISRIRSWRNSRENPTEKMIRLAIMIGLSDETITGLRKGELSRLIDIHQASRLLDKSLRKKVVR